MPNISSLSLTADPQGRIFIPETDGYLAAVDGETGKPLWKIETGADLSSAPIAFDTRVATFSQTATDAGKTLVIQGLSSDTGITIWRRSFMIKTDSFILRDSRNIYLASDEGIISALNGASGEALWEKKIAAKLKHPPLIRDNSLFAFTEENSLLEFSTALGNGMNSAQVNIPGGAKLLALSESQALFSNETGTIFCVRLSDKKVIWGGRAGAEIVTATLQPNGWIVASNDNFVYLFDAKNGKRRWKRRLPGRPFEYLIFQNGFGVAVQNNGTSAEIIDLKNGKLRNSLIGVEDDNFVSSPLAVGDKIILASQKGISSFSAGDCTQKKSGD